MGGGGVENQQPRPDVGSGKSDESTTKSRFRLLERSASGPHRFNDRADSSVIQSHSTVFQVCFPDAVSFWYGFTY